MPTKLEVILAFSHPLRVKIVDAIGRESASREKLARELNEELTLVAYHVAMLEKFGVIQLVEGGPECIYELAPPPFGHSDDSRLSYISGPLDEQGHKEVAGAISGSAKRLSRAKARASKRLAKAGDRGTDVTVIIVSFETTETEPEGSC